MTDTPGVTGIQFGNPEMQDFQTRYALARPKKICLLWDGPMPAGLDHITTGLIHKHICETWTEAEQAAAALQRQGHQ
jgi:hypothetical protein